MSNIHTIGSYGFEGLSDTEVKNLFSDGRFASQVIHKYIPKWYPNLHETKEQYVSFRGLRNEPYLLRMFTNGLKFMPSKQLGVGRQYDIASTRLQGKRLTIIVADAYDFPKIDLAFIPFEKLIAKYPSAVVPEQDFANLMGMHE